MSASPRKMQLRLVFALLRPSVRTAAWFKIPIRTLVEALRLAYYEHLSEAGLSLGEIARRFDQTPRHLRSLAVSLGKDFFAAEKKAGLSREIEDLVAEGAPLERVLAQFPSRPAAEVEAVIDELVDEQRIERDSDGTLRTSLRYRVLASDTFTRRVDALIHFMDATFGAVRHRLVHDDDQTAMIKTVSFTAHPDDVSAFVRRLEGDLRREIAALEEKASFSGNGGRRFTFGLALAPMEDDVSKPPAAGRPHTGTKSGARSPRPD